MAELRPTGRDSPGPPCRSLAAFRACRKDAFASWIWTDPDRTDRLARLYNDRFNNLVLRAFDGRHLRLPGASAAFVLRDHQKRVIWRVISAGSTYIAHCVGAGKTLAIVGSIMEQRRLGLINKAMLVVPGHCLAQAAGEFLALYPMARILVADETNCTTTPVHPRQRVKDTRAALVAEFEKTAFVHDKAKFRPDRAVVAKWHEGVANALDAAARRERESEDTGDEDLDEEADLETEGGVEDGDEGEPSEAFRIAAE